MSIRNIYLKNHFPPECDNDEAVDYALDEEDNANNILDELKLSIYDDREKQLKEPEMNDTKTKAYLNKKLHVVF